ncbi:hypothetical protein F070042J6_07620 [Bacteroides sp. f07]
MLLLIDLTSYTTNPENKTLRKRLYIRERLDAKTKLSVKMVAKPVTYINTDYFLLNNFAYRKKVVIVLEYAFNLI